MTGPNDVATMHVVTGIANGQLNTFAQAAAGFVQQQSTFAALVGPVLTAAQFRKAIASAAITSLTLQGDGSFVRWEVTDVDADFDDEAGRIKLSFDLRVGVQAATGSVSAVVASVGFQVQILTTA